MNYGGPLRRTAVVALLSAYAAAVVAVTVFPITPRPPSYWAGEPWWSVFHYVPLVVDVASFVLNVIMFVPFGVLVPLVRPAADDYRRLAGWAATASATIEVTQLVLGLALVSRRTVDVNDLIANTLGALLGLLVLRLAVPYPEHRAFLSRAGAGSRPPRRPPR
jgi:glycopeptide antibiotics resistance protein